MKGGSRKGGGQKFHRWGGMIGGIYMASTVSKSTQVWDVAVKVPGELGDCECYRDVLGNGELLEKDTMYWITDRTPHESLPLEEDKYRQHFL